VNANAQVLVQARLGCPRYHVFQVAAHLESLVGVGGYGVEDDLGHGIDLQVLLDKAYESAQIGLGRFVSDLFEELELVSFFGDCGQFV